MFAGIEQWTLAAPTDDFWKTSIFLTIVALGCFIAAFVYLLRKRIIEDTPTSSIRSAAQGYVELIGHGELIEGESIQAPLTQAICTWYRYSIEKRRYSGKRRRWVTVERGESKSLFRLVDETGETLIDPEAAAVTPTVKDVWYGSTRHPEELPRKRKWYSLGGNYYRYTEERMHPGDPLYAIGLFNTNDDHSVGQPISTEVRDLVREWKEDSDKLLEQYDHNSDGKLDLAEWEHVRAAALETVRARRLAGKSLPPVNIMGKTCDKRRPYLLSAIPQSGLVRRYTLYSTACIVVFLLIGPVTTWMILLRLAG